MDGMLGLLLHMLLLGKDVDYRVVICHLQYAIDVDVADTYAFGLR
jgi:hypothetical protein